MVCMVGTSTRSYENDLDISIHVGFGRMSRGENTLEGGTGITTGHPWVILNLFSGIRKNNMKLHHED
eukprot:scaffold1264_cov263-Chaetoceros_neogracile.AAC.6